MQVSLNHHLMKYIYIYICILKAYQFSSLLATERDGIVTFIPLSERSSIDDNNGVLHQSLGAYQLVVGSVVHHIDDTGLTGSTCK